MRLDDLLDQITAYNANADLDLVKKAYVFAAKAHEGQVRRSGEPYLVHPLAVASLLAEMHLDIASIAAALLHDTAEDTEVTLEEIENVFSTEIRELVDGVTKLGKIKFNTTEAKQAENFRKMIMAMAKDVRVILIKLADRVHNMRTLEHLPEEKQIGIAQETLDLYAPIANRLGIQEFKVELEDLALKFLKPDIYRWVDEQVRKRRDQRQKYIQQVIDLVKAKMKESGIDCDITGRLKHYYSIHRKMESQNIPFDEVHDLIAFRMLVDDLRHCYEALGLIHEMWRPVPGRFKDYIAMPKANNYQSLHTTVIAPQGERVEFQIRTRAMHETAEHGIAAHWQYKEGKPGYDPKGELKFKWIRRLLEWQSELSDPAEFLDTVKLDLFADDVYVFTPKGELRELPRGATPIDFAYSVHTDLGQTCVGAKVNGKIVSLSYQMKSGDSIEILNRKDAYPNKDWLKFVKTSKAKNKIRLFLKKEDHEQAQKIGQELLEKGAARYGWTPNKLFKEPLIDKFMKEHGVKGEDGLYVALGYGKVQTDELMSLVVPREEMEQHLPPPRQSPLKRLKAKFSRKSKGMVKVSGISDMLLHFGKCCSPVPGDSISGYVTRGRGVSIHVIDCPKLMETDADRRVRVEWDISQPMMRTTKIRVVCVDRSGMLQAMSEAISSQEANISEANSRVMDGKAVNTFEISITDLAHLRRVIQSLQKIGGIISVDRVRS